MISQVNQGSRVTLFAAKEVLIDAQNLRARSAREFRYTFFDVVLVPALNGGMADLMSEGELALTDPSIVGLKDLQSKAFRSPKPRAYAFKGVPKIAIATQAMVFGHTEVKDYQLITLAGVFECPQVGRLDANRVTLTVDTLGS